MIKASVSDTVAPWLAAISCIVIVWLLSSVHRFYVNYQNARLTGLPLVLCPVNPQNPLYFLVIIPLRPFLKRWLPTAIYERLKITIYAWNFFDKHDFHDRVGPVFILITTGTNKLWCADPTMAQVVLARRKDFTQTLLAKRAMNFLGENMVSSDGDSWARQRRLIAPHLNERVSAAVWAESVAQADQMADYMLAQSVTGKNPGSSETVNALRAVAINVLAQAGYGRPQHFQPVAVPRDPTVRFTYTDAVFLCTELLAVAAFVPSWLLRLSVMPRLFQTVGAALAQMPGLTRQMLDQERERQKAAAAVIDGGGHRNAHENIMSLLVWQVDEAAAKQPEFSDNGSGEKSVSPIPTPATLSEDEVAGNMFLVTAAGFDTTANTLAYAVVLLAAYPDVQRWVQDELDRVFGGPPLADDDVASNRLASLDYAAIFPQLVRCLALMYETLRLYPVVPNVTRSSFGEQTVTVGDGDGDSGHRRAVPLVGPYAVHVNLACLHTSPAIWGTDADAYRPARWVKVVDAGGGLTEGLRPLYRSGTFLPWSFGPRACPAKKMAQVEFVAVVAALFWRCTARPVPLKEKGETMEVARRRLLALAQDSQVHLALQMRHPERVVLEWVRR